MVDPLLDHVELAAIVGVALLGGLFQNPASALGTLAGHLDDQRLGEAALGITRAGQKAAEAAGLNDHLAAAQVADLVGDLVGDLDALPAQLALRLFQLGLEPGVEAGQYILPVLLAALHLVQAALHGGGEVGVHDVGEFILHQAGDHLSQGGGAQVLALLDHILPVQDGGDGGGVGGGPSDAPLLQGLDEGGLGVAGGRLGEVLFRFQSGQRHPLPFL